ncbi:MAG: hypothetical protein ACTSQ8_25025 [Candidatus Helarchaeota archaeon]
MEEDGTILLSYDERMNLKTCPNCKKMEFIYKLIKFKNHPLNLKGRVIIQCCNCGYWTDWYDGWKWHPKQELEK